MKIYTIGFTQKTAEEFFEALKSNDIKILIDVRLNNKSQLAGFAKDRDLKYFLKNLCEIEYHYEPILAPDKELLDAWKKKEISWEEYESIYTKLLQSRVAEKLFVENYSSGVQDGVCFLCSENTPENCHRRLLAEYLIKEIPELEAAEIRHI